jgi:hypothetical protein
MLFSGSAWAECMSNSSVAGRLGIKSLSDRVEYAERLFAYSMTTEK